MTGGVYDANADVTKLDFNSVQLGEYFLCGGGGPDAGLWLRGRSSGVFSLMYWYRDKLSRPGTPSAHGYAITAQQEVGADKDIVPFARYSWSSGTTAGSRQFATGVVFENVFGQNEDLVGFAAALAKPTDTTKRNETSIEAFYGVYLTPNIALTPDIQNILNPSNTTQYESSLVVSLRLRLEF